MDIEPELPDDFDQLSREKKIELLEELKESLEGGTDAGAIKRRMLEELLRKYRQVPE